MNTITPSINSFNNIQTNYKNNLQPKMNVAQPSFKGLNNSMPDVMNHCIKEMMQAGPLDIKTKMKFHSVLSKYLPEIMTPENFINNGRDSKVYRISDEFVAKIKRGTRPNNAVHFYDVASRPNKEFQTLDFYYGEPVIRLGKIDILKNATPTSNFIACGGKFGSRKFYSLEERLNAQEKLASICADLPQESYDNFAENLRRLNGITAKKMFVKEGEKKKFCIHEASFTPDVINPNNLIIADGKFKLVDELDATPVKRPNSIYTMLEPLLVRYTPDIYTDPSEELEPLRKKIYKKCLIAAERYNLPLESELTEPYTDFILLGATGNAGHTHTKLENMRADGADINSRLAYIHKELD